MIKIDRTPEPPALAQVRSEMLAKVAGLTAAPKRASLSEGYARFKNELHAMQHSKCCYCEQIKIPLHNDVEHYRPWSRYWWLGWNWDNLLFACRACNQKGGKEHAFPLAPGAVHLPIGALPPGEEVPELLDPTVDDPREHIGFTCDQRGKWGPVALSFRGAITLHTIGLLRDEFRDLLNRHVQHLVEPVVRDIREAQRTLGRQDFEVFWRRKCAELLDPARAHVALSEAVLRHAFPSFPKPPA